MKLLTDLLEGIKLHSVLGSADCRIESIHTDSRAVTKSSLFIAIKGSLTDGHKFINTAVANGASAVICETLPEVTQDNVCYLVVDDSQIVVGKVASSFYGFPSSQLKVVGVTGTNGKTTVATLLHQLFSGLGYKCGLLSTVRNITGRHVADSTHTTPDPITLQALLAEMVDTGCEYCFMEVSSHAVVQNRIEGIDFFGAVFTNLTHDHLDYHKTFDNYLNAKKTFFDELAPESFALVNIDDRHGKVMVQNTKARVKTYGLKSMCDYKAKVIQNSVDGLFLEVNGVQLHSRLVGDFNASNLLAIYGVALCCGLEVNEVLVGMSNLQPAEGRFETTRDGLTNRIGIVDYAHTPDALEKILQTIREIKPIGARVIVVVGCGGDRDKAKRPVMAHIATVNSDVVILTSDNPRSEDPESILDEMWAGIQSDFIAKAVRITDRKQAIRMACMMADTNDIILVAGKGHEKYQDVKGEKTSFDDLEILKNEMYENAKHKK